MRILCISITFIACIACAAGCVNESDSSATCRLLEIENDVAFDPTPLQFSHPSIFAIQGTVNDIDAFCSGFAISPGVVLTAAHCSPLIEAPDVILFGDGVTGQVLSASPHPELDVMLVQVAWDTTPDPIAIMNGDLDERWLQRSVFPAGYGRTTRYQAGVLHYYKNFISSLEADRILVDTRSTVGPCRGDSGGPLLARDDTGKLVAIGVLSTSSSICAGASVYTRLDVLGDWLPEREKPDVAKCAGLSEIGYCDLDRAIWCEDGVPMANTCASDCGWSETEKGMRCDPSSDCDGISSDGKCEDSVVSRCVEGQLISVDCGTCGLECGIDPGSGLAGCYTAPID